MKKLLLFILCLSFIEGIMAQDLEKMSPEQRNRELIRIAKETVLKYGPGYYRDYKAPIINRDLVTEKSGNVSEEVVENCQGWIFYIIMYDYNREEESFESSHAAKVYIWADTGKAFQIVFGNMGVFYDLDKPQTRNGKELFMPFEKQPPRK